MPGSGIIIVYSLQIATKDLNVTKSSDGFLFAHLCKIDLPIIHISAPLQAKMPTNLPQEGTLASSLHLNPLLVQEILYMTCS